MRGQACSAYLRAPVVLIWLADRLKRRLRRTFTRCAFVIHYGKYSTCGPVPAPHAKPIFMCTSYSTCVPDRNWIIIMCPHKRQPTGHNERAARHKLSRQAGLIPGGLKCWPSRRILSILLHVISMYIFYVTIIYLRTSFSAPSIYMFVSSTSEGTLRPWIPSLYLCAYHPSCCSVG